MFGEDTGVADFAWQKDAACDVRRLKNPSDAEWWFPSSGNSYDFTKKAKAVCNRCPVRDTCLRFVWDRDEQGTWGGMSREERVTAHEMGYTADQVIEIRHMAEAPENDDA